MRVVHHSPSFALAITVVVACAGTTASIEQSWRSPTARPGELTSVVTRAPAARSEGVRRSAEDRLAAELVRRGVRAVPGYSVLPEQQWKDEKTASQTLLGRGFDGVVTMRFVGKEERLQVYPTYYGYWGGIGTDVIPETIVRIEVSAYALPGNQLVWSAISKSVDPDSIDELVDDVAQVAANEMQRQQILTPTMTAVR